MLPFLPAGKILFQIVFSVWVTLNEQKWVTLAERRGPMWASREWRLPPSPLSSSEEGYCRVGE